MREYERKSGRIESILSDFPRRLCNFPSHFPSTSMPHMLNLLAGLIFELFCNGETVSKMMLGHVEVKTFDVKASKLPGSSASITY